MKIERLVIVSFTTLGIVCGVVSSWFGDLILGIIIPFIVYIVLSGIMLKFVKSKKKQWLISNSFITFVLMWLVVWISIFNLG